QARVLSAGKSSSRTVGCRGHEPFILRGHSAPPLRMFRGHEILTRLRGNACPVKNRQVAAVRMPDRCGSSASRFTRLADAIGQIEWTLSASATCHARQTTRACDTPGLSPVRINSLPNEPESRFVNREQNDSLSIAQ